MRKYRDYTFTLNVETIRKLTEESNTDRESDREKKMKRNKEKVVIMVGTSNPLAVVG